MRHANECGIARYVNEQGLRTQLMIPQSLLKPHMGFGSVITSPLSGSDRKFLRSSPKPHRLTFGRQRDFVSENCFWIRKRGDLERLRQPHSSQEVGSSLDFIGVIYKV